jgi:hypothetical protein
MPHFLVTYLVPVTVRVENVNDKDMAADIAWEWWNEQKVVEAGQVGLDETSFYFYNEGGEPPWALDVTVEEVP